MQSLVKNPVLAIASYSALEMKLEMKKANRFRESLPVKKVLAYFAITLSAISCYEGRPQFQR